MSKPSGQTLFLAAVIGIGAVTVGYLLLFYDNNGVAGGPKEVRSQVDLGRNSVRRAPGRTSTWNRSVQSARG